MKSVWDPRIFKSRRQYIWVFICMKKSLVCAACWYICMCLRHEEEPRVWYGFTFVCPKHDLKIKTKIPSIDMHNREMVKPAKLALKKLFLSTDMTKYYFTLNKLLAVKKSAYLQICHFFLFLKNLNRKWFQSKKYWWWSSWSADDQPHENQNHSPFTRLDHDLPKQN